MNRNWLFIRSVLFSVITKLFGFFVIFSCLPLAAISMGTADYVTFNYSMAVTGLIAIFVGPVSTAFVVHFANVATGGDQHTIRETAEETLTIFLSLGILLTPPAACAAYFLSPTEYRGAIALAATAVMISNILLWAEAFRVGVRQDYISSIFSLGNNITIIVAVYLLFRRQSLSFSTLLIVYYGSPLLWNLFSFSHLLLSRSIRIRWRFQSHVWNRSFRDAAPLFAQTVSDYIRLYGSSMLAFYLASPESYAVFSTVLLFIARLTNPFSLLARPLVPAYVDAIRRLDRAWITKIKRIAIFAFSLAMAGVAVVGVAVMFISFSDFRFGAIQIEAKDMKIYLVFGLLLFWSTVIAMILASVYLAQRKMSQFSKISLIANSLAVILGAALTIRFDVIALFAAIAVFNCISVGYLIKSITIGSLAVAATVRK